VNSLAQWCTPLQTQIGVSKHLRWRKLHLYARKDTKFGHKKFP